MFGIMSSRIFSIDACHTSVLKVPVVFAASSLVLRPRALSSARNRTHRCVSPTRTLFVLAVVYRICRNIVDDELLRLFSVELDKSQ